MTRLSQSQTLALHNLAQKAAGQPVAWISIADAQALTVLGLAVRGRDGWKITSDGQRRLSGSDSFNEGDPA